MEAIRVSLPDTKKRVDLFLKERFIDYSRSYIQKLIKEGFVKINSRKVKACYKLKIDDLIEINFPGIRTFNYRKLPFEIIYQDKNLIVINKPAGISVHPAGNFYNFKNDNLTIIEIIKSYSGINITPYLVHRLDRWTSGVLVIAKNPLSQYFIRKQFSERTVKKIYLGIVYGNFSEKSGIIDAPLIRRRNKIQIGAGKESITRFKVIESFRDATYIKIIPETGRTHQIRVHLSSIGHPVVGDKIYGRKLDGDIPCSRQMLHAYKLGLIIQEKNIYKEFKADIPDDFKNALKYFRKNRFY